MKKNKLYVIIVCSIFTLLACRKTKITPATPTAPTTNGTRAELSKDSIFLYAKEVYLWNDKLPTYATFNPRQYTSRSTDALNYSQVLFEITKYSNPYEYKTGGTSSKFSYIFDKANQNPVAYISPKASVDLESNGNDLGLRFGFYGTDANFTVYATAIYNNGPAEKAGMLRGDLITRINGVAYGTNFSANLNAINSALSGTTIRLEGVKSTGATFDITLVKSIFKSSPIYKAKVITLGTKKVGYLAYARFAALSNPSEANPSDIYLDPVFADFASKGVTDLVIDLRFNGGGYVFTAQYLINLIAPTTASGVMFTEHYNAMMQAGTASILKNQPLLDANDKIRYQNGRMLTYADLSYTTAANTEVFEKKGALSGVKNIVFIVSSNTASASELVINSLKPHVTVQLVGLTTYGKPVGFFPITIENKYDVYYSMFESKNSAGNGGYYDGFVPDVRANEVPAGTIMYDFGDVNDNYLKLALNAISPNVTPTSQARTMTAMQKELASPSSEVINTTLGNNEFNGMIDTKHTIKK